MRILIAEDDMASRKLLLKFFSDYGDCDITVDGMEAVEAFLLALEEENPYGLICLDIMMPKLDGLKALKSIRELEKQKGLDESQGSKVIIITALNDTDNVFDSFKFGCEAYITKPVDMKKLQEVLIKLGLAQ
ncbi:MAG: response regulator [Caulobacteraceae bacterium]